MATLTNINKNTGTLTSVARRADGMVFFGWLFLFTQPTYGSALSTVTENAGSLTGIPKS